MGSTFYVYAEDGLTLKYLKESLGEILHSLDGSNPEDCTVYYRPSFGKRGLYGEFDAIIITPSHAYLVESKWDESGDLSKGLRKEQVRRHNILTWYHETWQGEKGDSWNDFAKEHTPDFKQRFPKTYIPNADTRLSKNLQIVLGDIRDKKIENLLLVFYQNDPVNVVQSGFKIVQIRYTLSNGLFLELA